MSDQSGKPTIAISWPRPNVAVVTAAGEQDIASSAELERALEETLAAAQHLILDLSGASFIDSYTMGSIIKAKHDADMAGRSFNVVVAAKSPITKALEIAQVLPMLNRVRTLGEALSSL